VKASSSLRLERLEDRTNPSTLTVSFVPDGTQVGTQVSELYQDNAGTAPAVWQGQLVSELQAALSVSTMSNVTLTLVPDDGASMNAAAPQDGQLRIAAVDELFTSNGTPVTPPPGTDFMVAGGSAAATFGMGLGLVGPNGQPLSPAPTPPGQQTSGSMLPFILPVQKAYGNLYPNPPASTPGPSGGTTPSYSDPSGSATIDSLVGDPGSP